MKLSILIPTIFGRETQFHSLFAALCDQYKGDEVEICHLKDWGEITIGTKRNKLLAMANGDYVCFIDDDDMVSGSYIELLMKAIETDPDCASLKGMYSINGKEDGIFEHSIKYNAWITCYAKTCEVKYQRYPNHLNMIRASIAKQFKFPETSYGEDFEWSKQIHESGLLKTEYYIPEVLYYYRKITKK